MPAAAELPHAAGALRVARRDLLTAVDQLRTALINGDDLRSSPEHPQGAVLGSVIERFLRYRDPRRRIDELVDDDERKRYAVANTARPAQRRYVTPGDTVTIVLPPSQTCRHLRLAGRATRVQVWETDVELDAVIGPGQLRLSHHDAGVHREPSTGRLYVVQPATT